MKTNPESSAVRGMALITTLFLLAMFSILVVAFFESAGNERAAASHIENAQRAKLIAQGAIAHGIDILRTNIPDPALISEAAGNDVWEQPEFSKNYAEQGRPFRRKASGIAAAPPEWWVTNPGRLTIVEEDGTHRYVDLHTGEFRGGGSSVANEVSFDLNAPLVGETEPAVLPAHGDEVGPPEMRVQFVNVLDDPGRAPSKTNPIIARYAFWMDDETAKLNYNVASGKPSPAEDSRFHLMLDGGMMTPFFWRGTQETRRDSVGRRPWSLGHPRSVNLDVLLDAPDSLDRDDLLDHVWVHGFFRYPEGILRFFEEDSGLDPAEWYRENRFNLTFYSRGPEFNPFGRSRLFTTHHPLSLEAGPACQQIFIYDPNGARILNFNALMGAFGANDEGMIVDSEKGTVSAGGMINRWQLEMLMRYMGRHWPGYSKTFIDKYGEEGCLQICLNILNLARFATSNMDDVNVGRFSKDWAGRTASLSYGPEAAELRHDGKDEEHAHELSPERYYWRFRIPGVEGNGRDGEVLMLPQSPGPHVTEIGVEFRVRESHEGERIRDDPMTSVTPEVDPAGKLPVTAVPRIVEYRVVCEYYMPPFSPLLQLRYFPLLVDYFDLEISGKGAAQIAAEDFPDEVRTRVGVYHADEERNSTDWTKENANGRLAVLPPQNVYVAGEEMGLSYGGSRFKNPPSRVRIDGPWQAAGEREYEVPGVTGSKDSPNFEQWRPVVFDAARQGTVTVTKLAIRAGTSTLDDVHNPPRQMIPLGETQDDVLLFQDELEIDLAAKGVQAGIYWEIADPHLSGLAKEWIRNPHHEPDAHSLGFINEIAREPGEESTEKSKLKYIQRGTYWARWRRFIEAYRGDEYWSRGRLSTKGVWSYIHTGMQEGKAWSTLSLEGIDEQDSPPDWLLLELMGATYPMQHDQWINERILPDEFSTVSFMNSTMGQVNLNTRIYPRNQHFQLEDRTKPLEGVFKHLRSDAQIESLLASIVEYQADNSVFEYIGEVSEVSGYRGDGGTAFERESLLRNMAGCLTTNSNTFGMWGVAQTVAKARRNENYGQFESGDTVTGQKRFFAIIERYIWPGKDGIPGNAHVDEGGVWDRVAQQDKKIARTGYYADRLFNLPGSPPLKRGVAHDRNQSRLVLDNEGTFPEFDGPEEVGFDKIAESRLGKIVWRKSSLEDAYNPPQPVVKYRVVYFKYLD
ncbi:MAG: hypothetical protein AAGA58_06665 [Verrucomicrobiota bacterium]